MDSKGKGKQVAGTNSSSGGKKRKGGVENRDEGLRTSKRKTPVEESAEVGYYGGSSDENCDVDDFLNALRTLKAGGKGEESGGEKGQGSSECSYELYNLVCFSRKDFGLTVGVDEKGDSYKVLKEGSDVPVVVSAGKNELQNGPLDSNFTALDLNNKHISINDVVKISKGPSEGKQGVVKQVYRGILFLYAESEEENGGYFCCKSQSCEKIKHFTDESNEKAGGFDVSAFGDSASSPKSLLPLEKEWQPKEKYIKANQGDKGSMYSIDGGWNSWNKPGGGRSSCGKQHGGGDGSSYGRGDSSLFTDTSAPSSSGGNQNEADDSNLEPWQERKKRHRAKIKQVDDRHWENSVDVFLDLETVRFRDVQSARLLISNIEGILDKKKTKSIGTKFHLGTVHIVAIKARTVEDEAIKKILQDSTSVSFTSHIERHLICRPCSNRIPRANKEELAQVKLLRGICRHAFKLRKIGNRKHIMIISNDSFFTRKLIPDLEMESHGGFTIFTDLPSGLVRKDMYRLNMSLP